MKENERLCKLLRNSIWKSYSKLKPKRERWLKDMQTFLNSKEATVAEIEASIKWIENHHFWKTVVMSPSGLRRNFSRIDMQMNQKPVFVEMKEQVVTSKTPCRECGSTTYSSSIDGVCRKCSREEAK